MNSAQICSYSETCWLMNKKSLASKPASKGGNNCKWMFLITTLELKDHFPTKTRWLDKKHFLRIAYSKKKMTLSTNEMQEENLVQAMTLLT